MQNVVETADVGKTLARREKDFETLILPLAEPGYRLACAMLHDPQAAQDAVQEASLTAWRKLPGVRDRGKVRPWSLGIVVNECRNSRRLKWVADVNLGLPVELTVVSPEEQVLRGAGLGVAGDQ